MNTGSMLLSIFWFALVVALLLAQLKLFTIAKVLTQVLAALNKTNEQLENMTGSLITVTTNPPAAEIWVDGVRGKQTPANFLLLRKRDPVERTVTINLKGYKSVERKLVPDGSPMALNIELQKE